MTLSRESHDLHFPGIPWYQPDARTLAIRSRIDHTEDPRALHALAQRYGRDVAAGTIDYSEAHGRLSVIALAHWQVGPDRFDEVMTRVGTTLTRAAEADSMQADRDIRAGLQALLDKRAKSEILRKAAYQLSAARLLRPDCDAIVREEIAKRLQATMGGVARAR